VNRSVLLRHKRKKRSERCFEKLIESDVGTSGELRELDGREPRVTFPAPKLPGKEEEEGS
jgi:hypothetical protein